MVSRPKYFRGWVKGILAGVVATALFLMVAQDQETLTVESAVPVTAARFADYVASLTGAPVEPGDRYTVLRNGEQAFPAMLEAIRSARRRILFESFVYQDGIVGDQFTRNWHWPRSGAWTFASCWTPTAARCRTSPRIG